jgi:hypothetical protein
MEARAAIPRQAAIRNVVGILPGLGRTPLVVIRLRTTTIWAAAGRSESRQRRQRSTPGADDNASGVAV